MREEFVVCPRRFFWRYILHLVPNRPNTHLHAGKAYARGLEVARKAYFGEGVSEQEAIGRGAIALTKEYGDYVPEEPWSGKTIEGMLGAFATYFVHYPLASDPLQPIKIGSFLGVEFSFALPLRATRNPQTGENVIYMGRCDMLAELCEMRYVVDDKTTSRLGKSWHDKWAMRAQFTGYCWAANEFGMAMDGAIVRGVSILPTGFGVAQTVSLRPQWMINAWQMAVRSDLERMARMWEASARQVVLRRQMEPWTQALGDACCAYNSACPYLMLCESEDPEPWLEGYYIEHRWSPVDVEPERKTNE